MSLPRDLRLASSPSIRRRRLLAAMWLAPALALAAAPQDPPDAAAAGWQLAGRLGMAQYIVVPASEARDRAYHDAVIAQLCPADGTCFLRFFTNTDNAPVTLPLPDAIEHQPTAMFQRSAKMRREMFQWACRLQVSSDPCF